MENFRLKNVKIEYRTDKPKPKNPKFVQGLLGVGQVGLLAGKQLIRGLGARKLADLYSSYFLYPGSSIPGVIYTAGGTVEFHRNEFYYDPEHELFILSGLYQGVDPKSYYIIANKIIEFCDEFGVEEIYTLGGLSTGKQLKEPKVYAVIGSKEMEKVMERHGIRVLKASEGSIGVTGLAGLLIPLGVKNGKKAACLLGETHGWYPDPLAAKSVLTKLYSILEIEMDTSVLDEQIRAMEKELERMEEYEKRMKELHREREKKEKDLPYIG